jgi:hypothetical protein
MLVNGFLSDNGFKMPRLGLGLRDSIRVAQKARPIDRRTFEHLAGIGRYCVQ